MFTPPHLPCAVPPQLPKKLPSSRYPTFGLSKLQAVRCAAVPGDCGQRARSAPPKEVERQEGEGGLSRSTAAATATCARCCARSRCILGSIPQKMKSAASLRGGHQRTARVPGRMRPAPRGATHQSPVGRCSTPTAVRTCSRSSRIALAYKGSMA